MKKEEKYVMVTKIQRTIDSVSYSDIVSDIEI